MESENELARRFRRIVVGVGLADDGRVSRASRRVWSEAVELAATSHTQLSLLHSIWSDPAEAEHEDLAMASTDGGSHAESSRLRELLEELAEGGRARGLDVEILIVEERPWLEIVRRVLRGEFDLVMVANREKSGPRFHGGTTRKLLRKCPGAIWVVAGEGAHAPGSPRVVLAATDLSPVGDRAVRLAANIAAVSDGVLHVVHAWQMPIELQLSRERLGDAEVREALDAIQQRAVDQIRSLLSDVPRALRVELHVGRDAPSRAISRGVEAVGAELLVMGTLSRGGVAGLLMGNTAEKIVDRVECSLLAVKPDDFVCPVDVE